jgi:tetratricopeptide (TPR) repeat protein
LVVFRTLLLTLPLALISIGTAQVASPWETYLASGVGAAEQKNFSAAQQFMSLAMREAERFNANDPRLGSTLNTQGLILTAAGKPREAEHPYRGALAIFEKAYGPKSLDVANVGYNLSDCLMQLGKYDSAEVLLARVVETYQNVLGKDSTKTAQVYFMLGDCQRHLRNFAAAEVNLKRAADMREALNGMESPELATALNSLALCYTAQGKFGQAEPLFKLSLNIREAKYGLNNGEVVASLDNYAAMLREAGRDKDGEKLTVLADVARKSLRSVK